MKSALPPSLRFIGWLNVIAAASTPFRILSYAIFGLRVFSWSYAAAAVVTMVIVELILGSLTGYCGWGILRQDPSQARRTCLVAGVFLGYSGTGLAIMLGHGSRELDILIRRGYADLWAWSLSHFQPPFFVDLVVTLWWLSCLWRLCLWPAWEHSDPGRAMLSTVWLAGLMMFVGLVLRMTQLGFDLSLYSQR